MKAFGAAQRVGSWVASSRRRVQRRTVQRRTVQRRTVQRRTVQRRTVQRSAPWRLLSRRIVSLATVGLFIGWTFVGCASTQTGPDTIPPASAATPSASSDNAGTSGRSSRAAPLPDGSKHPAAPAGAGEPSPSLAPARSGTASSSATSKPAENSHQDLSQRRNPAWIGISMLQTEDGVFVEQVIPGSPAAHADLRPGDRLMRIAGEAVSTPSDVAAIVAAHQAGAELAVDFRRGGDLRLLRLETAAKPDTEQLLRQLYVGQPAPSLSSLRTVQGSVVPSLRQLRGRVVVLEFWASWCVACRAMTETLNRWHEDLGVLGVSVLGVTMDPYEEAVRATEFLQLRYPTFSDEDGEVTRDYRAMSLPTLFVIDKTGVVRDVMVGFHTRRLAEMGATLKELALEQPTAALLQGAKGTAQ